ncbi:MAG: hypothetical protein JST86_11275 [Bacteroidetes bacterium]|nr:hypothetical protein [Bacteroidota bacterium]
MKSVFKISALTVVFTGFHITFVHAQIDLSKYEVGLSGGVLVYQGDLTPSRLGSYKTLKPQLGLHVYRIINPSFSLRFNITRGKLYGNDAKYSSPEWRQQRNFNFTTPLTELSVLGVWNIMASRQPRFAPYVFAGAGLGFVHIKRDWSKLDGTVFGDGSDVAAGLAADIAKKLPRAIPVIPVGAGVRYTINDNFSAIAETNYRLSRTDYLDGFSQAANPKQNDHYLSHSIGIIYSFGKKSKSSVACPKMRY